MLNHTIKSEFRASHSEAIDESKHLLGWWTICSVGIYSKEVTKKSL